MKTILLDLQPMTQKAKKKDGLLVFIFVDALERSCSDMFSKETRYYDYE